MSSERAFVDYFLNQLCDEINGGFGILFFVAAVCICYSNAFLLEALFEVNHNNGSRGQCWS